MKDSGHLGIRYSLAPYLAIAATLGVVATLLLTQRVMLNSTILWMHSNGWVLIGLVAIAISVGVAVYRDRFASLWIALLVIVALIGGGVSLSFAQAGVYAQDVTLVADAQVSEYAERAPFVVARARTTSQMEGNGDLTDTTYIADVDTFTTPVNARGPIGGYLKVVSQRIDPATGEAKNLSCDFDRDQAGLRFGGMFASSLLRAIIGKTGYGIVVDTADSYAYCDGDRPVLVAPLQRQSGLFPVTRVPVGVAVYDGLTGDIEIVTDTAEAGIAGPVYPASLAAAQRDATRAGEGFWSYTFARTGYTASDQDKGSTEGVTEDGTETVDPNRGNSSEFNLERVDGQGTDYVTPLTRLGRSTRIVAIGAIDSSTLVAGQRNAFEVLVLPAESQREDNRSVEEAIRTQHDGLGWASGLQVFEIAPIDGDTWVATIGMSRTVAYRAVYEASTGRVTLATVEEDAPADLPEPGTPEGPSGEEVDITDLDDLSDEELVELQRQIADQIERRLAEGATP